MIGEVSGPGPCSEDARAWEGVVIDPEGRVDRAIGRRASLCGKSVLEMGHSSLSHSIKHSDRAAQVYAVRLDDGQSARPGTSPGLPANVNVIRCDASDLPLRDGIVDVAILRGPFPGSDENNIANALPEAIRTLQDGAYVFSVWLNSVEGDLGALIKAMMLPDCARARQEENEASWKRLGFEVERVQCHWRAPGRTILRRVLAAEFPDLPGIRLAEQVAISEMSCAFDVFWRRK